MFCQKCGSQNPEAGRFCRSCGADLTNGGAELSQLNQRQLLNAKGKPIHWEGAMTKLFTGAAFLIISIVLAFSGMGRGWWFWLLIPAFASLGTGIAQYMQLKKVESGQPVYVPTAPPGIDAGTAQALPPQQQTYVSPESKYKTGDLVPPSVVEGTTRHLEIDKEGQTMALPKK
jgi:hypothetical protein